MQIIFLSIFGPYLAALAFGGLFCMANATGSLIVAARKTFVPITVREFFFPPCAFCWLTRGIAAATVAVFIAQ